MKRSGIKRNAEATKAFVERGRGQLKTDPEKMKAMQQRAREKAREAQRSTPPGRGHPVPRPPGGWKKGRVRFRAKRPARTMTCAWPGCERTAASWHHWTPQQHIRVFVASLRIRDEEEERRMTANLLDDERNCSPFCSKHHGSHGTSAHEFTWTQVPASAIEFAGELGNEYAARLRRLYPVTRVKRLYPDRAA